MTTFRAKLCERHPEAGRTKRHGVDNDRGHNSAYWKITCDKCGLILHMETAYLDSYDGRYGEDGPEWYRDAFKD